MATVNVHIGTENKENLNVLYGIVQDLSIDIVGITETFFDNKTSSETIMSKTFGSDWIWFGKERKDQKVEKRKDQKGPGSGGLGFLARRCIGEFSYISGISKYVLWTKVKRNSNVFFFGVVYIPPAGSNYGNLFQALTDLEGDIVQYKKEGKVILLGDFNCKIGDSPSVLSVNDQVLSFSRSVTDHELNSRGKDLVTTMNTCGMVILNGVDSGGGFTFPRSKSLLDLIVVSDNLLLPDVKFDYDVTEEVDQESGKVEVINGCIPEDSGYVRNSMAVLTDYMHSLGDHLMVSCKLDLGVYSVPVVPSHDSSDDNTLKIMRWDRRDHGNVDYWKPMQYQLEKFLAGWDFQTTASNSVDEMVKSFNQSINLALVNSLKVRKQSRTSVMNFTWNPDIYNLRCEENAAYHNYQSAPPELQDIRYLILKTAKKRLKNAISTAARDRLRQEVKEIEGLGPKDIRECWRRLFGLDKSQPPEIKTPTCVRSASGTLVVGKEARQIWREAFQRLGLESVDFCDFDSSFYLHINEVVSDHLTLNPTLVDNKSTLDSSITLEEVKLAIRDLKRGKAVGIDGIMNEVFKYSGELVATYLWKLFDFIFTNEDFPLDWSRGLIVPLFKGGSMEHRYDPGKYRGITLLSIVGKTYTAVLNRRLSSWAESNNILHDEQAGFRKHRSTTDQLFILTECIISRRPNPTYVAFIDISKAYDRVWREGLWSKLIKAGIIGKMLRVLKNIYKNVESSVLLGQLRTDFFNIEVGVRQGCLLSPLLFDLFLNDIVEVVNRLGKGVKCGNKRVSILLFADDIALMAETREDLELMLKTVFEYSLLYRFKFNYDKCAVMVFKKSKSTPDPIVYGDCVGVCKCGYHWLFGKTLIQQVLIYKYLGIEIDINLTYLAFKSRIVGKARQNMGRAWGMGMKGGHLSVKGSIVLWKTLVRSILEYSSEIWGFDQWEKGEAVQVDMGRRILHCSIMSTKEAIRGDLGFWRLSARRDLKKIMYWFHILSLPDDRLLKQAYLMSKKVFKGHNWAAGVHKILQRYGLLYLWQDTARIYNLDKRGNNEAKNAQNHKSFQRNYLIKVIHLREQQLWRERMEKKDKLVQSGYTYYKKSLILEKYLSTPTDPRGRTLMFALRSGTNRLQVEMGRHTNQEHIDRLCTFCSLREVEDERHFLVLCPWYDHLRSELFEKIKDISKGKWRLDSELLSHQYTFLINGSGDNFEISIFSAVQNFLVHAFKRRESKI